MKTKHFISKIDKDLLVTAIRDAEKGHLGDIILLISQKKAPDPMFEGQAAFQRLSERKITHPHAVLIFLAPESQKLAIIGGVEIYKKLPVEWWQELVAEVGNHLNKTHLTEGLLTGILRIGQTLLENFPSVEASDRTGQSDLIEES